MIGCERNTGLKWPTLLTTPLLDPSLQCWSEIIETNAKNGVVFDATSNEQPI